MRSIGPITAILALIGGAVAQRQGKARSSAVAASQAATNTVAATVAASTAAAGVKAVAAGTSAAAASTGTAAASSGQNCITFTSDNPNWYYANSAPWTGSGTFGSLPGGKICLPSASAGGAMYIGSSANPAAGNTKFECYFPTDSSAQANCDMSLVDGYSLSVTCTVKGASQVTIGGAIDLWTTSTCPGGNTNGFCKNPNGYAATQAEVNSFFQPAIKSPNNYCIWVNCAQDSFFASGSAISCHVSAGTPNAKRDIGSEVMEPREVAVLSRRHARSLGQVLAEA